MAVAEKDWAWGFGMPSRDGTYGMSQKASPFMTFLSCCHVYPPPPPTIPEPLLPKSAFHLQVCDMVSLRFPQMFG